LSIFNKRETDYQGNYRGKTNKQRQRLRAYSVCPAKLSFFTRLLEFNIASFHPIMADNLGYSYAAVVFVGGLIGYIKGKMT
jgi:hypothetical protein